MLGYCNRLLVVATNWIGDAVMSIPVLRELRRLAPRARISLLVRPWVAEIYSSAEYLDEVLVYQPGGAIDSTLSTAARLKTSRFDAALLLPNSLRSALLVRLAGIRARIGYATDGRGFLLTHKVKLRPEVLRQHEIYYYLGILSGAGLSDRDYEPEGDFRPDISISPAEELLNLAQAKLRSIGLTGGRKLAGLNPGAYYGPAKRWPTARYAALADRLIDELAMEVVIFGSRDERRLGEEIVNSMRHHAHNLAGATSLGELIGLIAQCDLFITNDSGPMHLAAALGVPQVAIFGSSDERLTGPWSESARVAKHSIECSPCFLRQCPIDLRCFASISVDEVFAAVREIFQRRARGEQRK